uniref:Uncharacterized protein n=1 Tax=viral metagenome TaxID=1070528 RepID=A0A6C0C013_9ZZZZ
MDIFSNVLVTINNDFNDWIDYTFYNKEGGCGRKGTPSKRHRCRKKKKNKKFAKKNDLPYSINNEQAHNIVLRHSDLYKSYDAKDNLSRAIDKTKKHWTDKGLKQKRSYKQWFFNLDDPTYVKVTGKNDIAQQNNDIAQTNLEQGQDDLLNAEDLQAQAKELADKYYNGLYVQSRKLGFQNQKEGFDTASIYKAGNTGGDFNKDDYDEYLRNDLNACHSAFANDSSATLINNYNMDLAGYTTNINNLQEGDALYYGLTKDYIGGNAGNPGNVDSTSANFGKCVNLCRSINNLDTNAPVAGEDPNATHLGGYCINTMNQNQLFIQAQVNKIDSDIGVVSNLHTTTIQNSLDLSNISIEFKKKSLSEDKYKIIDIMEQNDVLDDILIEDSENHLVYDKTNSDYSDQSKSFNFYNSNIFIHIYMLLVLIYSTMILMDTSYKLTGKIMFILFLALFPFIAFLMEKYSFVFFKNIYDYVFSYVYAKEDY